MSGSQTGSRGIASAFGRFAAFAITIVVVLAVGASIGSATNPEAFAGFKVALAPSSPTAGQSVTVTITAIENDNGIDSRYAGVNCVRFSGPASSSLPLPGGTAPSYPGPGSCGAGNSSLTFSSGKAVTTVHLFDEQTVKLTVTDVPTSKSGSSASFNVTDAGAASFTLANTSGGALGSQTAGTAFGVKLTAYDKYGNVAMSYGGAGGQAKTLAWSAPNSPNNTSPTFPSTATSVTFTGGVGTATGIVLVDAQTPTTLGVDDANQTSIAGSASFNVLDGTLLPSFVLQPADAQVSMTIYSNAATKT